MLELIEMILCCLSVKIFVVSDYSMLLAILMLVCKGETDVTEQNDNDFVLHGVGQEFVQSLINLH